MRFLAVLKPDGVLRKAAGAGILKGLKDSGLCELLSFKEVLVPTELLAEHYEHVNQRSFYPWLLRYMSSYPSYVIIVEANGADIDSIRKLLGATRAHEADKSSLRYKFCPYGGANGLHLSEDEKAGQYEVRLWEQKLSVFEGEFDMPIDSYIGKYINAPNHTAALRTIFTGIASGERRLENEESHIKALLADECENPSKDEVDYLSWIFTDQL